MENWTIQKLLTATQIFLTKKGVDQPRLLSEILLAYILKVDRVYLFSHFDQPIDENERFQYRQAVLRCANGEPAAYIIGEKEFMSLSFKVSPVTLIPRPDTEILVETALQLIEKHGFSQICDVGTGSGCIPISIAYYTKHPLQITALDLSHDALTIAQENADRHHISIRFLESNLFQALPKSEHHHFELITANLPYVPLNIYKNLPTTVKNFEPRIALTDEQDGLSLYRKLIQQSQDFLTNTGRILLEIDPRQQNQLQFLLDAGFEYQIIPDLASRARVVCIKRKGIPDNIPEPPITKHFVINPEKPDLSILAKAASILQKGGLVAFPTETVYGLGAYYQNAQALSSILKVKKRSSDEPLLVAISNQEQLKNLVSEIPETAEILMHHFWPGPLSIIFPAKEGLSDAIINKENHIGIRMPANRVALELINLSGPITAPSANLHNRPSPTEGSHVLADLNGQISAVLDAGCTQGGVESTIVDCTQTPVKVIRLGAISQESLNKVLSVPSSSPAKKKDSPYQLNFQVLPCLTEMSLARKKEILRHFHHPYGLLSFDLPDQDSSALFCGCFTPQSKETEWFSLLRTAENTGIQFLLVHPFSPYQYNFSEGIRTRIERTLNLDHKENLICNNNNLGQE